MSGGTMGGGTDMDGLIIERSDGIVTLTLDRPERKNAITDDMWRGLVETFDDIATRRDDRVLVITGAGDAFCFRRRPRKRRGGRRADWRGCIHGTHAPRRAEPRCGCTNFRCRRSRP